MIPFSPISAKVRRSFRPTDDLPQTTQSALFTITGGPIFVYGIVGEVTTVIETATNNAQLVYNHASESDVDLCADLDITGDVVGTLYAITGDFSDAMLSGVAVESDIIAQPFLLQEGSIELDCSASKTGQVQWTLFWSPVDDAGTYVAIA
jgi:hypothetical protein